ncbi:mating-type protein MAT alpha 1 HMG-box domain-containing protein [Hirsutella rhossiliensis]|uniref:Mating-type protein MAT alpha 1 HMG-box domain-containing protein n=1 Tax=Hirsutella rhossiliensis TaxID=111463 RepID=A0A9P8N467_9HYPO|nr:mating-type protein MAT alpha 1 HMG-box domain-containing protein [Hirsutella rhossiliensis]KAH0964362.1 mating-type protein MAT alpha 1 HMG-box domain-containing protein [Hirsutella rhossiliensis]
MTTRAEVLHHLSFVRSDILLNFLSDDAIFQLASRYYESTTEADVLTPVATAAAPRATGQTKDVSCDRAKRPLNAFMAFRSYYLKLFPDVQQKTASGFLTTLWHKDPFRNKWALVAKVYSFVRDQIGKDKVSLAYFLSLACPIMSIIEPAAYLNALGWFIQEDDAGSKKLVQDESSATLDQSSSLSSEYPSTEIELLSTLVEVGYFPDQGVDLVERMGSSHSGIMATRAAKYALPVSYTKEKMGFIDMIRSDPIQASKDILGDCYNENTIRHFGVKSYNVENVDSITHLSMQREYQDPRSFYDYSVSYAGMDIDGSNEPVMRFDNIPENETFDIDSPFDLDKILGQSQSEGERSE